MVVAQIETPFECDWESLLQQTSRWTDPVTVEPYAREIVGRHLQQLAPGVIKPVKDWLQEEYLVINLEQCQQPEGAINGTELLSVHGHEIAQLVRGELTPLAPGVTEEILQSSLSYYVSDLVVLGASAALVYDRGEDAAATNQVLEYAKMQLLEFRYYDGLMTQLLSDVYTALERRRNVLLSRWSVPRDAKRFNTIRLDVMELTERIDNAIKFVSDIYYARLYRMAATRMGVPDYRNLVDEKLRTVGELYDVMVDQFNEARSFIVEFAIAILALLDVLFLLPTEVGRERSAFHLDVFAGLSGRALRVFLMVDLAALTVRSLAADAAGSPVAAFSTFPPPSRAISASDLPVTAEEAPLRRCPQAKRTDRDA